MALGGIVACGAVYGLIGVGVIASGTRWIERLMPPVVTGVSTSLLFRSRTWRRPASTPGCRSPGKRLQRPETAAAFLATPADFGRQRSHSIVAANATVEQPDMTLNEIVAAMSNAGIEGSRTAVWRFYERHGISFKKTLYAAEQKRAEVARARRRWMREQGMFDPARLVSSTRPARIPRWCGLMAAVPVVSD